MTQTETKSDGINVELLERVKAHILEEPTRFDMGDFVIQGEYLENFAANFGRPIPPCGTIACIAGWAVLLSEGQTSGAGSDVQAEAEALLGLSVEQRERLFYTSNWPKKFNEAYRDAEDVRLPAAALAAARRIDHFIKTNGAE